jgi:hypothetical protein
MGDDRVELGHRRQLALDDVVAAVPGDGDVDEAHHAEHALATG